MTPGQTTRQIAGQIADDLLSRPIRGQAARLLVIDGPAGSGKSTLASALAADLRRRGSQCCIVAMDDLYDGWQGLADPSLLPRVRREVVAPLLAGKASRHRVYDWSRERFGAWRTCEACDVVLLEGVGSMHVADGRAVVAVWLTAPEPVRRDRVSARSGPAAQLWWDDWARQEAEVIGSAGYSRRSDWHLEPAPGGAPGWSVARRPGGGLPG